MIKKKKTSNPEQEIMSIASKVESMRIMGLRGHIDNFRRVGKVQEDLSKFLQTMDDQFLFDAYDKLHELCEDFYKAIQAEHAIQKSKEAKNGGSTNKSKSNGANKT